MRQFKFFQKPVKGDLNTLDGRTRVTESFFIGSPGIIRPSGVQYDDTPEGHMRRRMDYHLNPAEYNSRYWITEMTTELANRINNRPITKPKWYERLKNWFVNTYGVIVYVMVILVTITLLVYHGIYI